ncbi:MAG: HEAT repeat domain-containing protein [Gemmataceae bacterium]
MRKPLTYVFGILLMLTVLYYGLSWYNAPRQRSLAELQALSLEGEDENAQELAALELAGRGAEAIPHLRIVLAEARSPRVQTAVIQGLGHMRDWDSMPALLEALSSDDENVRRRAGQAVTRILGADYNFRPGAAPDQRARVIQVLRAEYAKWKDNPPTMYKRDEQ